MTRAAPARIRGCSRRPSTCCPTWASSPAPFRAGLVAGGPVDGTAPTAAITSPTAGDTLPGNGITVSGTAADTGGIVASVEVSVDDGATWQKATGTSRLEPHLLGGRGTDHGPGASDRRFSQSRHAGERQLRCQRAGLPMLACSTTVHGGRPGHRDKPRTRREVPLRRGWRQSPASASTRRAGNTGPHTGKLWSTEGTNLGSVTFSSESATGWQEAALPTRSPIEADTTYVASYHTTSGHYATGTSFASAGDDNPPLHALQDGVDGPNGVYRSALADLPEQDLRVVELPRGPRLRMRSVPTRRRLPSPHARPRPTPRASPCPRT